MVKLVISVVFVLFAAATVTREPGTTFRSWQFDRERYRFIPLMNDGTVGPMLELRPMLEFFLNEVSGGVER